MKVINGLLCNFLLFALSGIILFKTNSCQDLILTEIPTVTVRGFLNFRTTVDGTVIVFTPAPDPPQRPSSIAAEVTDSHDDQPLGNAIKYDILTSKETVPVDIQNLAYSQSTTFPGPVQPLISQPAGGPKIREPYPHDHPSDNAVLPSTIQTNNDLDTESNKKSSISINHYPTGLVTVLHGTHVQDGTTTILETKVVGMYIDGKYAQILQSASKIIDSNAHSTTDDKPSSTSLPNEKSSQLVSITTTETFIHPTSTANNAIVSNTKTTDPSFSSDVISTDSTFLQSSFITPEVLSKIGFDEPTQSLDIIKTSASSKWSTPLKSTVVRSIDDDDLLFNSKSFRSSSRIRFTAHRRPSQTVKLNRFKVKLTLHQNATEGDFATPSEDEDHKDDETSTTVAQTPPEEITEIDIDPAHITYKETTITSHVTLHVGRRKSIRTLTITTSVPIKISATEDQENSSSINKTSTAYTEDITPSVITRTFTTTERTETTTLVPIYDGVSTRNHILTESLFIMKIVTAYRTLPPGDFTIVATDDTTESVNSIHPTLDVADNVPSTIVEATQTQTEITTETSIHSSPSSTDSKATDPLLSFGQALSNNPLAAVYLGLQQLNAHMTLYSTITQVSTYVTTDTIYSTKTTRFYDGRSTRFRTMLEPLSTKKRTVTTTVSSMQPYINNQALQQQQHLQKLIAATQMVAPPPPQPQYSTLTSIYTAPTTVTSLSTRIYTLIYNGFSTKYRTVTSTKVYPTVLTITSTKELPIQITHHPLLPFAYPYPAA